MIRRIVKLMFYIKAPFKAFVVFHPVRAAKLWLAYVLGSALFTTRQRAEREGAGASRWEPTGGNATTIAPASGEPAAPVPEGGGNGGAPVQGDDSPAAVQAGASVPQGDQA